MANRTLTYHRNHPKNRSSYRIEGNVGLLVIQRSFFVGAVADPPDNHDPAGLPLTLTLEGVELVDPKAKSPDMGAAMAKQLEKLEKMKAKIAEQQKKAEEKIAKAEAIAAAAKAKVAEARKAAGLPDEVDADSAADEPASDDAQG